MSKKGKKPPLLSPDDEALWQSVARDITPLKRQKSKPSLNRKRITIPEKTPERRASPAITPEHRPDQSRQKPEIDRSTRDRIRRGKKPIEARIDLHGLSRDSARDRLTGFIHKCHAAQRRMLLVITGKGERGQGVLRREVPAWLAGGDLAPLVLAVEEAQIKDGGSGALYVYLRRIRA